MNVIYIHTHDTGRVISPYGYQVDTPNYQKLCEDSLLFQNAFSVAPTCSPSRAGLLTGVYPHQNGMLGLAQRGFDINRDIHLANILARQGYRSVLCGVQHEIGYYTNHEMAIGTIGYQEDITSDCHEFEEKNLVIWDQKNAKKLGKWLDNYNHSKPFFISYGMHATHREYPDVVNDSIHSDYSQPPVNIPNNEQTRKDYAQYKTSLKIADDNLGFILAKLKENNLYEQTIILLTTDHGLAYPFEKCTLYDSGIGVLLAIRVPNTKNKEKSFDGLISHIDVVPTLLDLLNIKKPDYLEGRSFANLFTKEEYIENDAIYGEINFHTSYEPVRAVRTKRYKYIRFFDREYTKINLSNVDDSPIKRFYMNHGLDKIEKSEEYLFDLYYDGYETNNLVAEETYQPELVNMRLKLDLFMKKTQDPLLEGALQFNKKWKINKRDSYSAGSKNVDDYDSLGQ